MHLTLWIKMPSHTFRIQSPENRSPDPNAGWKVRESDSGDGIPYGIIIVFECFVGRKLYSYIYKSNYSTVIPGNGFHDEN